MVDRAFEIVLGMLVASLGVILAGFDWLDGFPTSAPAWIQRAVCAALGVVGVVVGFRVARGRGPEPDGALLSPHEWRRVARVAAIIVGAMVVFGPLLAAVEAKLPAWLILLVAIGVVPVWWIMVRTFGGVMLRDLIAIGPQRSKDDAEERALVEWYAANPQQAALLASSRIWPMLLGGVLSGLWLPALLAWVVAGWIGLMLVLAAAAIYVGIIWTRLADIRRKVAANQNRRDPAR